MLKKSFFILAVFGGLLSLILLNNPLDLNAAAKATSADKKAAYAEYKKAVQGCAVTYRTAAKACAKGDKKQKAACVKKSKQEYRTCIINAKKDYKEKLKKK